MTDNPAKAPEPTREFANPYATDRRPCDMAKEKAFDYNQKHGLTPAVPAQVAAFKCYVEGCDAQTYCHECTAHLKNGVGHTQYCSKAAQPVSAPSPEIPLPDLDHLEYLAKGGFLFTHKEVIPLLSALRVAQEERTYAELEAQRIGFGQGQQSEREARKQAEDALREAIPSIRRHVDFLSRDVGSKSFIRVSDLLDRAVELAVKPVSGTPNG